MKPFQNKRLFVFLNAIEVIGIFIVLLMASSFEFIFHELPCPLCLLQRVGMVGICIGLLLNLRFKAHPAHYSLTLLSALLTGFVALRQVALHVVPGTGSYGDPIFGYHLYTWSFILSMCVLIYTSIVLAFGAQYDGKHLQTTSWKTAVNFCFALVAAIIIVNVASTYAECGLKACPDNPTSYFG